MDFSQDKLSKKEWDAAEIPVSPAEMNVLRLITGGFVNVNIKQNGCDSIFTYLKIEYSEALANYIYNRFLKDRIAVIAAKNNAKFIEIPINAKSTVIKTADKIRMEKTTYEKLVAANVYELVLMEHISELLSFKHKQNPRWTFHYFTLFKLLKNTIPHINTHIITIVSRIIDTFESEINMKHIIANSSEYIERNSQLLAYADMELYEHQKQIITISKDTRPKLVLYIAPTGTGKTLTPLALSEQHRIIFVCAARHVGLALARAAISVNKRIAFAFGCSSADNVRLHYFSAKKYTKNRKTGGIYKVDNAVGSKVEIMICDIRSYIPAMHYMLSFNEQENIITYWDEPTITMDYKEHEFHAIIKRNWNENLIPNVVLSSATLPKLHELTDTVADFMEKFPAAIVHNIVSHDCRKTIPIINRFGYAEMPHYLCSSHAELQEMMEHCDNYRTLMRYYDLTETARLIEMADDLVPNQLKISRHFSSIDDVSMQNIKMHYNRVLRGMNEETWNQIHANMVATRMKRIMPNERIDTTGNVILKSASIGPGVGSNANVGGNDKLGGKTIFRSASVCEPVAKQQVATEDGNAAIYVSTKDAYTLTDGPTIFIVNDVDKIARFCIQQANIPACVMDGIMEKIEFNNKIVAQMEELEKEMDSLQESQRDGGSKKSDESSKKQSKTSDSNQKKSGEEKDEAQTTKSEIHELSETLLRLQSLIKLVSLNETFVPNKLMHIAKWAGNHLVSNAFTSNVDEETVVKIVSLVGVSDSWKILLLLGIGVMAIHPNPAFTEIMKTMADNQQLYMIIATSDYIYGTNYQFCHGYISKDMCLTQEKIIQAMGRIGRNNIQQEYSIRFRDDDKIRKLFTREEVKQEVINMNRLFNSRGN
jgi:hypothetical protein